ncbi:MAG: acyl-CoA thioesterase [Ruminococcus sp.]|nr:acyl-CoA thioesterase [Ruminococcus sp.]HRR75361.1 acyl-CoA thioesterase [Ruminococcus sp.]
MNTLKPYERSVFYYETDKMGVVHHSNYIRIFDETRVDYLQQAGIPFEMIEELGILLHTLSVHSEFKRPLVFAEPFAVYMTMTKFNGTTLELDYRIQSRKTGEVNVTGHSVHCFTDMDMKPIRMRNKFPELYQNLKEYLNCEAADN